MRIRFYAYMKCPVVTLVSFCFLLASCASVSVDHEFNPEIDLVAYRTFGVLPNPHPEFDRLAINVLGKNDFALAVASSVLQQKGFMEESGGEVDFFLGVRVNAVERKGLAEASLASDGDFLVMHAWDIAEPPRLPGYTKMDQKDLDVVHPNQTTDLFLYVDMFDAATQKLVWQGWAKSNSAAAFNTNAKRAKAIEEILSPFPN
ncbi:DUF4136 domain-containing protein [Pelagicoccus sp. SDUM812003]|uniref:DUF4136 domain-containing protein n=1 Tax=Pelagicoccus sp. SDUM812003 TaxID=3041267 RepID=UPI00280EAB5D|nr:DUF4136 domain-containing protein [Pelagicoccus sp. SDUM812003]MDQ8204880.1 DUF4136 domain-containing protein [Pelagicoccus sp. SDUM812003]